MGVTDSSFWSRGIPPTVDTGSGAAQSGGIGVSRGEEQTKVGASRLALSAVDKQYWQPTSAQDYPPISDPIIVSGSYTPSGSGGAFINLGFDPDYVFVCADAVRYPVWRCNINWYGRTDHFYAGLSKNLITSFRDGGFTVTNDAKVGAAGTTYYYLAVKDNGSGILKQTNLFGNGQARTLNNWLTANPALLMVKRDNANAMVLVAPSTMAAGTSPRADGQGPSTGIKSITAGEIVMSDAVDVNELNGPAGFGEAINYLAWMPSPFLQVTSYTGNNTAGRAIALNFQPEFVMIVRNDGVTKGPQICLGAFPSGTSCPLSNNASALTTTSRLVITPTGVTVDADTGVNESGVVYTVFALKKSQAPVLKIEAPLPRVRPAVYLSGVDSYIDCGTSDTLKLVGACSFVWQGAIRWQDYVGADCPLIVRAANEAAGPGTQGNVSWGLTGYQRVIGDVFSPQSSVDYKGVALRVICSNFFDLYETGNSNPEAPSNWDIRYSPFNSGMLIPEGVRHQWVVTHNGTGLWRLYLNGEMVKERRINMVTEISAQNINSPAGQRTVIGARAVSNNTTIKNSVEMLFELARVYSVELTPAQAKAIYRRKFLGYEITDVTTSMVEEWDAKNVTGMTLTATVNSANSGAIKNGSITNI